MKTALIGYTGFVGSTLCGQTTFDEYYNSKNIDEIRGKQYEMVVCAGAPAVKWLANNEPEKDLENINNLMDNLSSIKTKEMILISTVDVYPEPVEVNEDTLIDEERLQPYGKHRYLLEKFVAENFVNHVIIRLPALFGTGLKKNFIYDLLHNNALDWTHKDSVFQFYPLINLWKDITTARENGLSLVNFSTEPLVASDIARDCFGIEFTNVTDRPPADYNMKSNYSTVFDGGQGYLYKKEDILMLLNQFIESERKR